MNELAAHKREVADVNRLMRKWTEEERFEEIERLCGIVRSHLASASEAAWRQDGALTRTHLAHARDGLILALKASREGPTT